MTKEVGQWGGVNVGGFSWPIEHRWSKTVHNSISTDINCAFSCYPTITGRGKGGWADIPGFDDQTYRLAITHLA